jgi:hypothetical protein
MTLPFSVGPSPSFTIGQLLSKDGFAFVPSAAMEALLQARGLQHWESFARSWEALGPDRYMADGGRYRRRRHAAFQISSECIEKLPHRPHFQTLEHNPLNGGIERWFDPIEPQIGEHPACLSVLATCNAVFTARSGPSGSPRWLAEVHQFRIEASAARSGKPTPEGIHRDGVDWVLIMLVKRANITGGMTVLHNQYGEPIKKQVLSSPFDALFLNDKRVLHGTTEIWPVREAEPAFRDVLVVTFRLV